MCIQLLERFLANSHDTLDKGEKDGLGERVVWWNLG